MSTDEWEARSGVKRRYPLPRRSKRVQSAAEELPVLSAIERAKVLKNSGLSSLDSSEDGECEAIRQSRDECGCVCESSCDSTACSCVNAGIACQVNDVDDAYPCACTRDTCSNPNGRETFDSIAVNLARMKLLRNIARRAKEEQRQAPKKTFF